jgi:O-antigen/teichoic acid export membrane protein
MLSSFAPVRARLGAKVRRLVRPGSLGERFAHAAGWSFAGVVIARLLGIASSVVVARLLGKEGFGQYGIIQSTAGMFETFAGFGLGLTATKFVAQWRYSDPARAGRILGLSTVAVLTSGTILAAGLLVGAPWLASRTLAAPQLAGGLRIGALLILLTSFTGAQTGALVGLEAFKVTAKINLYAGLASVPLVVLGVVLLGLDGALWGLTGSAGVNWLLNHFALRRETAKAGIHLTFRGCLQEMPVLWGFSLPSVMSGMLASPVNWVCSALLVNQPNGYAEMGIASAANQWFYALLFVPRVLARCSIPVLAERLGTNDKAACRKVVGCCAGLNAAAVVPLVLLGCLFGRRYMMSIYGAGFSEHSTVLIVAMMTAGVLAVQMPMGQMTAASGRMWTEMCMNLGWSLVFCGGTWLSLSYGAMGLMSARLVAYVLHTVWTAGFVFWLLREGKSGRLRCGNELSNYAA